MLLAASGKLGACHPLPLSGLTVTWHVLNQGDQGESLMPPLASLSFRSQILIPDIPDIPS
jgi:hypothetical protein